MIHINPKDLTGNQIDKILSDVMERIEGGYESALDFYLYAAFMAKLSGHIREIAYPESWNEYQLLDEKKLYGAEMVLRSSATTYDFEQDEEYKTLSNQLKARRALLTKAAKSTDGEEIVSDGEIVPKVPIKTPGKETIAVTIK